MDIEQLKTDIAAGTLSLEKLLAVSVAQQKRIAELEAIVNGRNPTPRVDEAYSAKAEELRKRREELNKKRKAQQKARKEKGT